MKSPPENAEKVQWGSWNNSLNWRKVSKCLNFIWQIDIWKKNCFIDALFRWCLCPWVLQLLWKPISFFWTVITDKISIFSQMLWKFSKSNSEQCSLIITVMLLIFSQLQMSEKIILVSIATKKLKKQKHQLHNLHFKYQVCKMKLRHMNIFLQLKLKQKRIVACWLACTRLKKRWKSIRKIRNLRLVRNIYLFKSSS